MKHPMQQLYKDSAGVIRFTKNAIVEFLLEDGPFDMNQLSRMSFSEEDKTQFAQLIGYSRSGFCDLPYVSDEACAQAAAEDGEQVTLTPNQQVGAIEILQEIKRELDSIGPACGEDNWTIPNLSNLIKYFLDTVAETETQAGKGGNGKTAVYSEEMYANDAERKRNNKLLEEILAEIRSVKRRA